MTQPQRFTDEQTREILSAAADRQAEADRAGPLVAGSLSLPEIQAIAEEVGIDREHVAHAAREILVGTQIGGRMYRGRQERRIRTLLDRIDLALRSEEDDHA